MNAPRNKGNVGQSSKLQSVTQRNSQEGKENTPAQRGERSCKAVVLEGQTTHRAETAQGPSIHSYVYGCISTEAHPQ